MTTSITARMGKLMAAVAMAAIASLFCAGNAFAAVYVDVTFPASATTTATETVQIDQAGVQNASAAPVVGMFYKSDAWNVLVTGTAAGQYASWDSILTKAVAQYNANHTPITVAQVNGWATNKKLSLKATDGAYTKYYPQGVDLKGDATGAAYFFDQATNSNVELVSGLYSSTYPLVGTLSGSNPNNVGPAFAWKFATAVTDDDEAAGDAAQAAAANVAASTAQAYPRLIMGCAVGSDTSTAMGKRYCTNIEAITLS